MTRLVRRAYLYGIAVLTALGAIAFAASPGLARDVGPPKDADALARWIAMHPADWVAASAMTELALDTSVPQRIELWHASYELADRLAPRRPNVPAAFMRAGLFHWSELDASDRKQVLDAAAPLLREPVVFSRLYSHLFDLTHDFAYLRRNAPATREALSWLSELAVTNGLFHEYRELREAERRERWNAFQKMSPTAHSTELIDLLPPHLDARDEPLVRALLSALERAPFDAQRTSRNAESLALYAMRNRVQPLESLAPLIETQGGLSEPTRARLALAIGNVGLASKAEITNSTRTPEWAPYHLERALYEARTGDRAIAEAYLTRAALIRIDVSGLSTAEQIARLIGKTDDAARYHAKLLEEARAPRQWTETCSENELCERALTTQYVPDTERMIRITANVVQSDQTPPYLEVYVDDALVNEGAVRNAAIFEMPTTPGLHRVEVRLVNRWTRNRIQRRVRLS
ncbi:MAG TPA: hypothetical protein VJZ00_06360 [Thermoanaerobaculia bacterium]|nr:hypothetical protein [Thermoanaerobaculia bacterium]